MTAATAPKRLNCHRCLRPASACLCQWITPIVHQTEVLILQHPLEVNQAKGSARLLHLSLPHSQLVVGETFDEATLHALLTAPFDASAPAHSTRQAVLLYPQTPDMPNAPDSPTVAQSQAGTRGVLASPVRLIVLDGTWRKSRKMLHLNPLLQQLPRLALSDMSASNYKIRKAHRPDQLSTLEATCAALAQLENQSAPFEALLSAFDGFVAQQMGFLGIGRQA
jgi:DTW domain-containing protein YfiP